MYNAGLRSYSLCGTLVCVCVCVYIVFACMETFVIDRHTKIRLTAGGLLLCIRIKPKVQT